MQPNPIPTAETVALGTPEFWMQPEGGVESGFAALRRTPGLTFHAEFEVPFLPRTPVIHFRRTATRDTELAGQPIRAGDKLVLWYISANRDEAAFDDPHRFDLQRSPNEHVGFGGPGPHYCLGAHLARREITVMFRELFRRLPDLEITGPPQMLASNFIHGIKHMPCAFTPRSR